MAPPTQLLEADLRASAEDENSLFLDSGESSLQLSKEAEKEQEELLNLGSQPLPPAPVHEAGQE
jgi:hypothetical protein